MVLTNCLRKLLSLGVLQKPTGSPCRHSWECGFRCYRSYLYSNVGGFCDRTVGKSQLTDYHCLGNGSQILLPWDQFILPIGKIGMEIFRLLGIPYERNKLLHPDYDWAEFTYGDLLGSFGYALSAHDGRWFGNRYFLGGFIGLFFFTRYHAGCTNHKVMTKLNLSNSRCSPTKTFCFFLQLDCRPFYFLLRNCYSGPEQGFSWCRPS